MMLLIKLFLILLPLVNFTRAGNGDQIQYDGNSSVRNQPSNINDKATSSRIPPTSDRIMANSLPVSRNVQVDFPRSTENSVTFSTSTLTSSAATDPTTSTSTTTTKSIDTAPASSSSAPSNANLTSSTFSDTQISSTSAAPSSTTASERSSLTTTAPASPVTYITPPPYPQQPYPYQPSYPYQPPYYPPPFYYPPPPFYPPYYPPYYPYPPMNYTQTTPIPLTTTTIASSSTKPTSTTSESTTTTVAPTDGSTVSTASTKVLSSTMSTNDGSTPKTSTPAVNESTSTSTTTAIPPGICPPPPTNSTPANNDTTSTTTTNSTTSTETTLSTTPANDNSSSSSTTSSSTNMSESPTTPQSSNTTISTTTTTSATPPGRATSPPEATTPKTVQPTSDCGKTNSFNSVPNECDTYVECKDGVSKKHYCPDGLVFKPSTKWSDYPCVAVSEYKCTNGSFKQKTVATELCPHRNGYFLKKDSDCSQYVVCKAGKPTIMHCASGLVFNVEKAACDWPANVPSCKAEAFKDFECPAVEADDSDTDEIFKYSYKNNCKKYVACQGGYPRLLSCDSGLHFSEKEEMCVDKSKVTDCVD